MPTSSLPSRVKFGPFELDPRAGELWRLGERVHIQEKPLRLLQVLLRRRGEVVTRAELQKELWPQENFLDFEDGLNTAMRKLREALGDAADQPRYVETVPRRGYRWIGEGPGVEAAAAAPAAMPPRRWAGWRWVVAAGVLAAAAGGYWLLGGHAVFAFRSRDSVLVADMDNQTGEARLDRALDGALTVSLEQSNRVEVFPRDRLPGVLRLMGQPEQAAVTAALGREICRREGIRALVAPAITRTGSEYAVTAELIDPDTGAVVRSYSERAANADAILDGLGRIADGIRRDLGESVLQVRRNSQPLPEVTTSSLAALQDYADGERDWNRGQFSAAVALYRSALAQDPHFAMAHAALAVADCSYIYYAESECRSEYALALAPDSRLTERERALINASYAADTDDVTAADTLYQAYLRRYPEDWPVLNAYAHFLRQHGHESDALAVYQRLERIAPDDAGTLIEAATADTNLGQYGTAVNAYRKAFQIDPHWQQAGDTNREYGFTLVRAGELSDAAAAFGTLSQDPELRAVGLDSLARLDLWQGELRRARSEEQAAMAAQQHPVPLTAARSRVLLAQMAEADGDHATAARELTAAMADFAHLEPKVAWGSLVGQEWARMGNVGEAQRILDEIAPLASAKNREESGYVRLLRGEIAVAQGHAAEAVAIFGLPDRQDGDSVHTLTIDALAHANQQAGNLRQAVTWYEELVGPPDGYLGWEAQPRAQAAYYWLASDELALGDAARARTELAPLLHLFQNADAGLPLLRQAQALEARLAAPR